MFPNYFQSDEDVKNHCRSHLPDALPPDLSFKGLGMGKVWISLSKR